MFTLTTTLCAIVRDTRYLAGALLITSIFYVSCGRQLPVPQTGMGSLSGQRKPATSSERARVRMISDVTAVLNVIYQNPAVTAEVYAAIASGYYADERVLLADLLYPDESPLYQFMRRKRAASGSGNDLPEGVFSASFHQASPGILQAPPAKEVLASARSLREVPLSIYHPYSEDFLPGEQILAVAATVEGDWVDVPDPACGRAHVHGGDNCSKIRIDEAYVQSHPVHIVGLGARMASGRGQTPASFPERPLTRAGDPALVYLGKVKCTRQYDRLISFTGNGGGSELKFIRGEAYITLNNNQQVANTAFDIISVNFRRKDIRKEREKHVYAIWDPNWSEEKTEQVFGVYEEDTQGEREFSGSVETEVEHPGGETSITPVAYSYKVRTQDNIIRQISWDRVSFFRYNRGGLAGCGQRNGYTWYDCHLPVSYSLPER